mmetsp:Transcript_141336/g.439265  ORF Transcript_141336/g.439265 Transcript_141336/m.439265 type:complete len:293 (+) Transcript_141336:271-1149(+)
MISSMLSKVLFSMAETVGATSGAKPSSIGATCGSMPSMLSITLADFMVRKSAVWLRLPIRGSNLSQNSVSLATNSRVVFVSTARTTPEICPFVMFAESVSMGCVMLPRRLPAGSILANPLGSTTMSADIFAMKAFWAMKKSETAVRTSALLVAFFAAARRACAAWVMLSECWRRPRVMLLMPSSMTRTMVSFLRSARNSMPKLIISSMETLPMAAPGISNGSCAAMARSLATNSRCARGMLGSRAARPCSETSLCDWTKQLSSLTEAAAPTAAKHRRRHARRTAIVAFGPGP